MAEIKRIHGAGGGGGGGGNQTTVIQQTVQVENPVKQPTYTADDPGLRSTSFAQMQFLLCDGEIAGPGAGDDVQALERSVFLDNTPIRVGDTVSPQPDDLVFSWGRPSPQQTGVPGYTRVSNAIGVDTTVENGLPVSQNVTVADANSTWYGRVILTFNGLALSRSGGDNPGIFGTSVNLRIEYEDQLNVIREVFTGDVSGKFSGPFQREFEFQFEGVAPWTVRVIRNTADDDDRNSGDTTFRSEFNFSTIVVSLDQRLIYPHSSVLTVGIRADQYSQLPNVSVDVRGLLIEVPSNYDPVARTYTGDWDGTFQVAHSDNPAWVLRDLILNERYGLGQYVAADQVDRWTLYTIAQYCDGQVPAPNGGTEPRFTCNLVLQTSEQAWVVLQQLSSIFRGLLYYAGGTIISIQDRPADPVFTFSEANTIENVDDSGKVSAGNFTYAGTAQRARHTAVLASWDDPADNFQPRVEYVADEEGLARFGYRALDLRLIGVTSRGQALRAANWALLSESLLHDTVAFKSNEIGSAVRPGDVVAIADPTKAARRYGGRIAAVNPAGAIVTLDDQPVTPAGGWGGTTFSYMDVDDDGEPVIVTRQIASINGDTVNLVENTGVNAPVAGRPWLLESPDRTAQLFRILSVEEQEDGIYAFSALRYREDIYDTVDNDTPLNENEDYLYRPINPQPPTITTAQVIWDNNQAKLNIEWQPADSNTVLNGFDITTRGYRLQYQAGSLQDDDSVLFDGVWREVETQYDTREQISIKQYVGSDRFRVRLAAISRYGAESEWVQADVDDITIWFPMPDLAGDDGGNPATPNAVLSHLNQSSGSQLFSWLFNVPLPPYVNGVRLMGRPATVLDEVESAGLNPPDADGWYTISDVGLDDYYAVAFHALRNWEVRMQLTTAIPGLIGNTFSTDTVDIRELYPPTPTNFRVVIEGGAQSRVGQKRFSWEMPSPPPLVERWPLGVVNDIQRFEVRYRQGITPNWDNAYTFFSDGIAPNQTWFETNLFDYGQWVVMIKAVDITGWESTEYATITVNIGDPLPTNVVLRTDLRDLEFPGTYTNFERIGIEQPAFYLDPLTDPIYPAPTDDEMYEGITGFLLRQVDPALPSSWRTQFSVSHEDAQLVIYTAADATYRWFIRKDETDSSLMYPAPLTDEFYGREVNGLLISDIDDFVVTENVDNLQLVYNTGINGLMYLGQIPVGGEGWHPYAPNEKLEAGVYEARLDMISLDGSTKGRITDADLVFDYPDVWWQAEDLAVAASGTRVTFPFNTFRHLKAVQMTVQDNTFLPGVATFAVVEFKDAAFVDIRALDATGQPVAGVVDLIAVGY